MNVNIFSAGQTPLLQIRYMGCNRRPHLVNIGPLLRHSYIIHYVTSGRGFYNGNLVEKGQGFLMTPGHVEEYHADPDDPWELLWVVSEDDAMNRVLETFGADARTGIFSYNYVDAVSRTGEAMLMMPRHPVSCDELLELFLGIYKYHNHSALYGQPKSHAEGYIDFAMHYIHLNYQNDISISELSSLLGVSQSYLFRIFKEATGLSPKQYLSNYRLLQAKKLLRETSLSVSQVAASVGCPDALAFSRFFSSREKISPQKYRRKKLSPSD